MTARRSIPILSAPVLLATLALAAGCGDDGNDGGGSATTQTQTSGAKTLVVKMDDYSFDPKDATAAAGSVRVTAPNVGKVVHELVLVKTDEDPGSFKVENGKVDEQALEDAGATIPGEIADVPPGETKSKTIDLTAGKYAMICNVAGHYQRGMYGGLTVK